MTSDAFEKAFRATLMHEGGFVDHPNDPGGATNWGISLRYLESIGMLGDLNKDGRVDVEDVRSMTVDQAREIYWRDWWQRYRYDKITSPTIAAKIFDLAVNMGAKQAHILAQRAYRAASLKRLVEDGIIGPKTLEALNSCAGHVYLPALRAEAAGFYRMLAAQRPALSSFLEGWLNRAYS